MRICFVAKEFESLGIEYLSSFLKNNSHEVFLVYDPALFDDTVCNSDLLKKIFSYKEEVAKKVILGEPELICFSVVSDNLIWAYNLAAEIKKYINIPIVFGGIHPTSVPEFVLENKNVDFVVMGEGEYALLDLVNNLEDEQPDYAMPNICLRKNGKIIKNNLRPLNKDLDSLPFPDKGLFYNVLPKVNKHYTIITSRGCPYNCTYCGNSLLKKIYKNQGVFFRRRSTNNVIQELELAKDKYHIKDVIFDDEVFTHDVNWLKEFSASYEHKINLPCFLWVHPNTITEETVFYLKRMNCYAVEMGVQSINPKIREEVLHRYYSNERLKSAIKLLKTNKISCIVDNIVALPKEDIRDVKSLVQFYNETRPDKIYVFYLRFFPKTEIIDIADLKPNLKSDIEQKSDFLPFTLGGNRILKRRKRLINKLLFNLILIPFLPRKWINFIIEKRIYFYFPSFNPYNILEIIPFLVGFLKRPFKKILPNREVRDRYFPYMIKKYVKGF